MHDNLTFEQFENFEETDNRWEKYLMIGLLILAAILLFISHVIWQNNLALLVFILLFVVRTIIGFKNFFSVKKHRKDFVGTLTLSKKGIFWKVQLIEWKNIIDFEMKMEEIEGQYDISIGNGNIISHGINPINIKLENGTQFNGFYKLPSETDKGYLEIFLKNLAEEKRVKYEVAKQFLKPDSFQEIQELKKSFNHTD